MTKDWKYRIGDSNITVAYRDDWERGEVKLFVDGDLRDRAAGVNVSFVDYLFPCWKTVTRASVQNTDGRRSEIEVQLRFIIFLGPRLRLLHAGEIVTK